MLVRWRLFLTWMLMAALPLQGFAAGTMLLCPAATHEIAAQKMQTSSQHQHDHATHVHEAFDVDHVGTPSATIAAPDLQHQCNLCAACCHSVGITEPASISSTASAPQADLADPFVLIASHPVALPDKPPRA